MQTILITGGTGMVGTALAETLAEKGYKAIILTRKMPAAKPLPDISYALWDIKQQQIDINALQQCQYIIHLAGAGVVDKPWTQAYKDEMVSSRVDSSRLIVETLHNNPNHVKAVISASAIGYYGEDKIPGHLFIEDDGPDKNFLGETCRLWEESIEPVAALGKRLVKLRMGIVLSNEGGAMAEFKKPLRFGVAAILGSGKQVLSWIHIDDLCRMFIFAIENDKVNGTYNAVSPMPVSNKVLAITLARLRKKFFLPIHVPAFILKLMLGQRSIEVLKSASVSCEKIIKTGFKFLFPSIEEAIKDLVNKE